MKSIVLKLSIVWLLGFLATFIGMQLYTSNTYCKDRLIDRENVLNYFYSIANKTCYYVGREKQMCIYDNCDPSERRYIYKMYETPQMTAGYLRKKEWSYEYERRMLTYVLDTLWFWPVQPTIRNIKLFIPDKIGGLLAFIYHIFVPIEERDMRLPGPL